MTPDDFDAVLPRAATWPPRLYDLTDDEERAEACEWLAGIVSAVTASRPPIRSVDRHEQMVTVVLRADADPDRAASLVRELLAGSSNPWHDTSDGGWPKDLTPEQIASTYKGGVKVLRRLEQYGYRVVPAPPDSALCGPESDEQPRDPHEVLDGDTWTVKGRRAVVTGSNDWGPPEAPSLSNPRWSFDGNYWTVEHTR